IGKVFALDVVLGMFVRPVRLGSLSGHDSALLMTVYDRGPTLFYALATQCRDRGTQSPRRSKNTRGVTIRIPSYSLRSSRSESPATTNPARPSIAAAMYLSSSGSLLAPSSWRSPATRYERTTMSSNQSSGSSPGRMYLRTFG